MHATKFRVVVEDIDNPLGGAVRAVLEAEGHRRQLDVSFNGVVFSVPHVANAGETRQRRGYST